MSRFPDEKHFCSWLGLAPKHEISGGKVLTLALHASAGENNTLKTRNRAGQAFRTLAPHAHLPWRAVPGSAGVAAQSVKQAECVFGVFYRRLRARLGPSQATVATAHATPALHQTQCGASVARVVYRMLKYRVEYEPLNINEYQRQYEAQQIKYLKKRAAKFGFQLLPT